MLQFFRIDNRDFFGTMKAGSNFIGALKLLKIPKKSRLSILKNCNMFFIPDFFGIFSNFNAPIKLEPAFIER
jgi:hypothetical protein